MSCPTAAPRQFPFNHLPLDIADELVHIAVTEGRWEFRLQGRSLGFNSGQEADEFYMRNRHMIKRPPIVA